MSTWLKSEVGRWVRQRAEWSRGSFEFDWNQLWKESPPKVSPQVVIPTKMEKRINLVQKCSSIGFFSCLSAKRKIFSTKVLGCVWNYQILKYITGSCVPFWLKGSLCLLSPQILWCLFCGKNKLLGLAATTVSRQTANYVSWQIRATVGETRNKQRTKNKKTEEEKQQVKNKLSVIYQLTSSWWCQQPNASCKS